MLAVILAWLWRHGMQAFARVFLACTAGAVATDIVLRSISKHINGALHGAPWHLTQGAPSGHACVSLVIYGSIGALFVLRARGATRWIGALLALAVLVGVDVTRITLGFHSQADVSTGVVLGGLFAAGVWRAAQRTRQTWPPMTVLLVAMVATAAVMHVSGIRFDSNSVL